MPRTELDRRLSAVRDAVLSMGADVEKAISRAMTALATQDCAAAQAVMNGDDAIDRACVALGDMCANLITMQQPAVRDLRIVLASLAIAEDLERIGDHVEGIASLICRLPNQPDSGTMLALNGLGVLARVQLQGALDSYRAGDATRARAVWSADDDVDALHRRLVASLIDAMSRDADSLLADTYLLWLAHNLEQIADRAGAICERVVFIATGERRMKDLVPARQSMPVAYAS